MSVYSISSLPASMPVVVPRQHESSLEANARLEWARLRRQQLERADVQQLLRELPLRRALREAGR